MSDNDNNSSNDAQQHSDDYSENAENHHQTNMIMSNENQTGSMSENEIISRDLPTSKPMNIFLSSEFDPLRVLHDNTYVQPPITNVKPYKSFSALNLNQLLARPTNKQQQIQKSKQTNPPDKNSRLISESNNMVSGISFEQDITMNTAPQSEALAPTHISSRSVDDQNFDQRKPSLHELPPLQPHETYEYFLERKYSRKDHPYQLLYDCFVNKSRVLVRVRMGRKHETHYSTLVGTLSGFDKFFNLILLNVIEEYYQIETIYKKQKTLDKEKGITNRKPRNRKRAVKCYIPKQRSFPLLFVKGCYVILLSRADTTQIQHDSKFNGD